jgi:hypothetical protein
MGMSDYIYSVEGIGMTKDGNIEIKIKDGIVILKPKSVINVLKNYDRQREESRGKKESYINSYLGEPDEHL